MKSNEPPGTEAHQELDNERGPQDGASEVEKQQLLEQTAAAAGNVALITHEHEPERRQGIITDNADSERETPHDNAPEAAPAHVDSGPSSHYLPGHSGNPVAANDRLHDVRTEGNIVGHEYKVHELLPEVQHCAPNYTLAQGTSLVSTSYPELAADYVGLEAAQSMLIPPASELMADSPFLEPALSVVESEAPRIQAFAKLEFEDGQFYMNTYSVELGRDIRAARLAFQRDLEANQQGEVKVKRRSSDGDDVSQTPSKVKHDGSSRLAGSVVSETGGIMGVDLQDRDSKRKKKSKISKSTSSSSQYLSRKNSMNIPSAQTDYQSLAMASISESTVGAHPVDPLSLLPSPDECPLIPIHPPAVAAGSAAGHKGISRKHVRIAFNFEKHLFEVEIKGKNGAFVDEQWHAPGEVRPLKSGSYIQIGGVGVRFVLPDVALGETGAETIGGSDPAQGSKMSFEFEDARGERIIMDDSSEEEDSEEEELGSGDEEDEDDEDDVELEQSREAEVMEEVSVDEQSEVERDEPEVEKKAVPIKKKQSPEPPPLPPPPPAKRKGPGRPPKNGIISKREQALIARKAREEAKRSAQQQASPPSQSTKGKGGKIKSETQPESPLPAKPEKRKYTKRKKVDNQTEGQPEDSQAIRQSVQADGLSTEATAPPKPPKEKKPPKPPRSPSPVFDESQMTPEQLAKPQSSYVVLIHEALTNSKTGAMSLPQIYRAIERRYPFYKLRVTTTGWQSSVRHNLSQHHAFRKVERDGKGWMWGLVPGVSIEKEKKRRPSPPPPPHQHYLQQGSSTQPPLHYPGMPSAPGYGPAPMLPIQHGSFHQIPPGSGPLRQPLQPPVPANLPPPLLTAVRAESSYQSPYQPPSQTQVTGHPQPSTQSVRPQPHSQPQYQPQTQTQSQSQSQPQSQTLQPQMQPPPLNASPHNGSNGFYANTRLSQAPPHQPNYQARATPPNQTRPTSSQQPTLAQPSVQRNASIGQDVLQAVGKFKNALISSMPDKVRGEIIVTSAINRTLGIQNNSTVLGKEDPQEKAIMKALQGMLGNLSKKNELAAAAANAARQPSSGPPQQPNQTRSTPPQGQQVSPGPSGLPPPQPQLQPQSQSQPQSQQQQQQQPPSTNRPPSQSQQGAQAQLLQLLQHMSNRGTGSPTQQRPPQQSGSPASASPTQVNGTSHPSPPSVSAPAVVDNSQPITQADGMGAADSGEEAPAALRPASSSDAVAGLKRPLENGEGSPDPELPEAKKIAAG